MKSYKFELIASHNGQAIHAFEVQELNGRFLQARERARVIRRNYNLCHSTNAYLFCVNA
jgi:hypothetical protein